MDINQSTSIYTGVSKYNIDTEKKNLLYKFADEELCLMENKTYFDELWKYEFNYGIIKITGLLHTEIECAIAYNILNFYFNKQNINDINEQDNNKYFDTVNDIIQNKINKALVILNELDDIDKENNISKIYNKLHYLYNKKNTNSESSFYSDEDLNNILSYVGVGNTDDESDLLDKNNLTFYDSN